jgi:uncharacterized membrane protein YGL010W
MQIYTWIALSYFLVATLALMGLAVGLLVIGLLDVAAAVRTGESVTPAILDAVGRLIIGFAIVETAKFIAEEEIVRKRELRSPHESRRSLTKFVTIIVIAASLEALVMVFRVHQGSVEAALYPAVLLGAAMFALLALGGYQWLSSRIDPRGEAQEEPD